MRLARGLNPENEYGYRGTKKPKHTYVSPKKRVRVTLYDQTTFTDKFLRKEGRFHFFEERGRVKSSTIYQLTIMPKSYEGGLHQ